MTELLNRLPLLFFRLGSHVCHNGYRLDPTVDVALDKPLVCPVCGMVNSKSMVPKNKKFENSDRLRYNYKY